MKWTTLQIGIYREAISIWLPSIISDGAVESWWEEGWLLSEIGLN
jgi:hypothetical protein